MPRKRKPPDQDRRRYGSGSVVRRPTGSYQAQLYAEDGRRVTRTFDTRRQADDWLARTRARRLDGTLELVDNRLTTGELLDWWLETYGPRLSSSTRAAYTWSASCSAAPIRGIPAARLRADQVQRLINALADQGRGLSTLRTLRTVLRQAFSAGVAVRKLQRVPLEGLRLPEEVWHEPAVWTAEQTMAFLEHADRDELALFWRLLFGSGMRQGELRGLRWEAIDWDRGVLIVRSGQSEDGKRLQLTKNRRRRPLRLDDQLLTELRELHVAAGEPGTGHVFLDNRDRPFSGDQIRVRMRTLVEQASLPPLTPHGARHTVASVLRDQGADLKDVQEILGHSSITITANLYTHSSSERQAGAFRRMADALRKRPSKRGE